MAFDILKLTLVGPDGNSDAGRHWRYVTEDALTAVDGSGYFNAASGQLRPGDKIDVVVVADLTADPYTVSDYGSVIVLTNALGVVDTSDETAFTLTDSD